MILVAVRLIRFFLKMAYFQVRICLFFALIPMLLGDFVSAQESQIWNFDQSDTTQWELKGEVATQRKGPRPPEFPDLGDRNEAFEFNGSGYLLLSDQGEKSFYDFKNGDELTIEAWVRLGKVRDGEFMYVVGKGRSNRAGYKRDNQNWALRVVADSGSARLSFLFATERSSGDAHWHRWTSEEVFGVTTGWHHIAICYRFGDPKSIKGWIDGLPTSGKWDMGGETQSEPVVDNDSIAVGSAAHGGKANQFKGEIDYLAIHRTIIEDEVLASRFKRTGGRIAWGPLPAEMPQLGELESGRVRMSVGEGWPDHKRWLNQGEQPPEDDLVWHGDEFLLPRLPARFDDWGIRQGWGSPVLLRLAADVYLPSGTHEFLLRARGLSRLWVDGELVVSTLGKYRKTTNLESIDPVAKPPMPGGRPKSFSQEEIFGAKTIRSTTRSTQEASEDSDEAEPIGDPTLGKVAGMSSAEALRKTRVVLEVIVGGPKLRCETTELTVACRLEGETDYQLLLPDSLADYQSLKIDATRDPTANQSTAVKKILLTDQMIEPVLERIEKDLLVLDDQQRRRLAGGQDEFWKRRHQKSAMIARREAEQSEEVWNSLHGGSSLFPKTIDQWINQRVDQVLFDTEQGDGELAKQFHDEVLPILREHCFRCHSEKAQGGLSLNRRQLALGAGDSGETAVVPGDPDNSQLMVRVIDGDMPPGQERLTEEQIEVLRSWIRGGAAWPSPPAPDYLAVQVPVIGDEAFLRRVYLDTIGLPPTEEQIVSFLAETDSSKRAKVIDDLLGDEEFASNWMSFWMDLLAENPTLLNASLNSTGPFRWFLHDALRDNKSLDRMVTELIMMRGSTHDGGSAGFGLAGNNDAPMAEKAHILASTFLGIELQCARCHDSPFHSTTQEDLFALAAMLQRKPATPPETSRVPDEFFEKQTRESLIKVTLPLGQSVDGHWPFEEETGVADDEGLDDYLLKPDDSRERLAALITSPANWRFPRVIVNHLWNRLIGAGLVEPLHDWEGSSPSHPELLDWLALELVQHDYDFKHVLRLILNSELYQKESRGDNHGVAPEMRFFHAPDQRRLLAEQVVDSFFHATGQEMHAGELTFVHDGVHPMNRRLTLGSPERAWEFASLNNERDRPSLSLPRAQPIADVLQAFGWTGSRQKPIFRRDVSPNVLQPGILSNGTLSVLLTRVSAGSDLAEMAVEAESVNALLDRLYLRFLSRYPTAEDRKQLLPILSTGFQQRLVTEDQRSDQSDTSQRRFPQITWTNHLVPEANEIQLELQGYILAGPPADTRFETQWRELYEDVVWSLVNHREFVWMP